MHFQKATSLFLMGLFLAAGLSLNACGVKPSRLDPPSGNENSTFPNTYPNENEVEY